MLTINGRKVIFFIVCQYFSADSPRSDSQTLLYANRILQQGNLLSCANIPQVASHTLLYAFIYYILWQVYLLSCANNSQLQDIRYCLLIINCCKLIFYHVVQQMFEPLKYECKYIKTFRRCSSLKLYSTLTRVMLYKLRCHAHI